MALVQLEKVSKVYRSLKGGDYTAVRDFSLDIQPGEFFCLLGTSGCGKTTVLNMVAGFEPASAGIISISGRPIGGPAADRGVVFQGDDSLYGWLTAMGNIEFGLRMRGVAAAERRRKAQHYLELVGLKGQNDKHPTELSGGMKQRIQIARVLANEPQMLLMDEPFAALDAHTRADMQRELKRICASTNKTVLFITHDIDEAIILADRIGVMHAGPASKLKGIVEVKLSEAERERTHDRFVAVYRQVHEMIRDEVALSLKRAQ
ncbi:MAG TPA: ABC transporter ATP-binding protein [Reyranella sp.]|jgi:NitT/TauT family transport system ATP-binding protein|nr:ABC transporter ATP-binding protein [Reyranella sp.]